MKEITRDKASDIEVLNRLLMGDLEESDLTEHQMTKLRQMRSAHAMLLDLTPTFQVIGKLMQVFDISQSQAWRVVKMTEQLLGSNRKANKEFKRMIAEEMAKETYRMAKKAGDSKAMAAANRAYNEATGINIEDPELPDFEKLQPSLNIIVINPDIESRVLELLSQGPLDLAELRKHKEQAVVDIPHEEIKPNDKDGKNAG